MPLGAMRYVSCASPTFMARHFAAGVTRETLASAPCLHFDRRDARQSRWAAEAHGIDLAAPSHVVPATNGFLDFGLAGLAWALHPLPLAEPHLAAGTLVELPPERRIDVKLYWTVTKLHVTSLRDLTAAICESASKSLAT